MRKEKRKDGNERSNDSKNGGSAAVIPESNPRNVSEIKADGSPIKSRMAGKRSER